MKVEYILETYSFLTKDKIYEVLGVNNDTHMYLIKGDNQKKSWCPKAYFERYCDE